MPEKRIRKHRNMPISMWYHLWSVKLSRQMYW